MSIVPCSDEVDFDTLIKELSKELERRIVPKTFVFEVSCFTTNKNGELIIGTCEGSVHSIDPETLEDSCLGTRVHQRSVSQVLAIQNSNEMFTAGEDSLILYWRDKQIIDRYEAVSPIVHLYWDSSYLWIADLTDKITAVQFIENEELKPTKEFNLMKCNTKLCQISLYKGKKTILFYSGRTINFRYISENQEIMTINTEEVSALFFETKENLIIYAEKGLEAKVSNLRTEETVVLPESGGNWNFINTFEPNVIIMGGFGFNQEACCCKFWDLVSMTSIFVIKFNSDPLIYINCPDNQYFFLCTSNQDLIRIQKKENTVYQKLDIGEQVVNCFDYESGIIAASAGKVEYYIDDVIIHLYSAESQVQHIALRDNRLALHAGGAIGYIDLKSEGILHTVIEGKNSIEILAFGSSEDELIYVTSDGSGFTLNYYVISTNSVRKAYTLKDQKIYQIESVNGYTIYVTDWMIEFLSPDLTPLIGLSTFSKTNLKFCLNRQKNLLICAGDNEIVDIISLTWSSDPPRVLLEKGISSSFSTESKKRRAGIYIGFYKSISSIALNSDEEYLVVGKDDGIQFWYLKDEVLIWKFKFHAIRNMIIRTYSNLIYFTQDKSIFYIWDPSQERSTSETSENKNFNVKRFINKGIKKILRSKTYVSNFRFSLLGPGTSSLYFLAAIDEISRKKIRPKYNYRVYQWVAFPASVNMMHFFVHIKNQGLIEKAFLDGCPLIRMKDGRSPLSIALKFGNKELIEIVLKKIVEIAEVSPKILSSIEADLSTINTFSPPSLSKVYNLSFPIVTQKGLKNYGNLIDKSGVIIRSSSYMIDESKFLLLKGFDTLEEISIVYRVSAFRMNLALGSSDSLKFMNSLIDCTDNEVFRTQLVKSIILYKWKQVKNYVLMYDTVYVMSSLFILYYVGFSVRFTWFGTISIFILNSLFLAHEFLQLFIGFKSYLKSLWNMIDLARIISCYIFLIVKYKYFYNSEKAEFPEVIDKRFYQMIVIILVLFVLLRGLSFFELFDRTRSMIKVFRDVIKDSLVFLLLLAMTTLAFTCLFMILDDNLLFFDAFTTTYSINFGAFKIESYTRQADSSRFSYTLLACFLFATLINPLLMVNLLVSIFNDTFARLKENLVTEDLKALAELVSEHESLMLWRRWVHEKQFIQICSQENNDESQDEKRARKISHLADKVNLIKDEVKNIDLNAKKDIEWFGKMIADNRNQEIGLIEKIKSEENTLKNFIGRSKTLK